jgi:hypothetical protein
MIKKTTIHNFSKYHDLTRSVWFRSEPHAGTRPTDLGSAADPRSESASTTPRLPKQQVALNGHRATPANLCISQGLKRSGHPCYRCAGPLATAVQQALSRAAESPRAPGLARAREDPPLSIVQAATDAMMLVESSIELVGYRSPWGTRRQSRLLQRWTRRQSRLLQRCPSPPRDRAPPSSWLCASPAMAFLTAYGILGQARS